MHAPYFKACDIAWFSSRLEDVIQKARGPIYIDLPNISASSLSSRRTRASANSVSSAPKSLLEYFSLPSATNSRPHDDIDGILNLLTKKDVRNAAREVERLRLIKSPAEIAVMKRAADISSQAHSDASPVSSLSSAPPL